MEVRLFSTEYTHHAYSNGKLESYTNECNLVHIPNSGSFRYIGTFFGTQIDEFYEGDQLLKSLDESGNLKLIKTIDVPDDLVSRVISAALKHKKDRTKETEIDYHRNVNELRHYLHN